MPAARAAAALAPTATNRRPGSWSRISTATTTTAITATTAVFGMPSVLCAAKLVSPGGLDRRRLAAGELETGCPSAAR